MGSVKTSDEIRRAFTDFFVERGHLAVPSASLVPSALDQSVLLTTAGMQPFKPYFLGQASRPAPRLTSVQRCFRAVDIDVVGSTERHMTFFQMMGNFSFGDYFKPGAVEMAWELSTGRVRARSRAHLGDGLRGRRPARPRRRRARPLARPAASRRAASSRSARTTSGRPGRPGPCGPCSELYYDRGARARLRRRGLQAGLRLRPLPRVLEPRLHGVRPRRRRLADAAAGAEHRHGQRPRARRDAAAGRRQHLRDRPDHARDRRARAPLGQALRRRRRRRALVPRALRPRPRHGGDRHRRRDPVQRGARLRAAPHPAARRPARQPPRPRDAVPGRAARGRDRVAGRRLPRARRAPRRRAPPDRGRGGALLADARHRLAPARRPHPARPRRRASRACTPATSSSCTTRTASRSS